MQYGEDEVFFLKKQQTKQKTMATKKPTTEQKPNKQNPRNFGKNQTLSKGEMSF